MKTDFDKNAQTMSQEKKQFIALTGPAGSGKSTAADALCKVGYIELALAGTLKDIISEITGTPRENFDLPELKTKVLPDIGVTPRQLCQVIGTECFRNTLNEKLPALKLRGGSIWIHSLLVKIDNILSRDPTAKIVVSDCRFHDEYVALHNRGFHVVKIDRGIETKDSHESEQGCPFDSVIKNTGSIEELHLLIHKELGSL